MSFGRQIVDLAADRKPADIRKIAFQAMQERTFDVVSQMRDELCERGITLKNPPVAEDETPDLTEAVIGSIKDMSDDQLHAMSRKVSSHHDSLAAMHSERSNSSSMTGRAVEAHRDASSAHRDASDFHNRVLSTPRSNPDGIGKEAQFRLAASASDHARESTRRAHEIENRKAPESQTPTLGKVGLMPTIKNDEHPHRIPGVSK